ncbi:MULTISPECIES: AraC family transcriptional regulator [Inquilinus]|uniref:AraC-like DNA-binding protein n=1 Tax=Inquilinus ginsengisoli TaxID=363840 RepID=A0ABU1JSV9_9PROT|nr:helix-turn-helix transcriptional regulator [Inquilinus ginsengisoli]MDR6291708.1 AraC-like DNA-binding protein [Inquilinus ginsengisoli]
MEYRETAIRMRPGSAEAAALDRMADEMVRLEVRFDTAFEAPTHAHRGGLLFWPEAGSATVGTAEGRWCVPTGCALWMPPGLMHEASTEGGLHMHGIQVPIEAAAGLPAGCRILPFSPLLRELALRAATWPQAWPLDDRQRRVATVMLDEMAAATPTPLLLPMPRDRRARRLAEALLAAPGSRRPLAEWARIAAASPRTLERLFGAETGLSVAAWQRRALLLAALDLLGRGRGVTAVALELGYDSPSAFIAMFRRSLGTTPARYRTIAAA